MSFQVFLNSKLADLQSKNRWRSLPEKTGATDFSHNDYLGLSKNLFVLKTATEYAKEFGAGVTASRLISGNSQAHKNLEELICCWKQSEASLLFTSGYAANVGTISALMGKGDLIIMDKLCHASMFDGAKLSGATYRTFKHKNYDELKSILQNKRSDFANVLILTDSVFSMDGTIADLKQLVSIKKDFDCWLYVDEAHATGVFGPAGQGLSYAEGLSQDIDISVGTLSKALGSQGGFICGSQSLIDYMINTSRSFIYSTGLNAFSCGAAFAAIQLLIDSSELIHQVWKNKKLFENLTSLKSESPIIPVVIGEENKALQMSQEILAEGYYIKAIRPPTVPLNTSRLRITITAIHTEKEIKSLAQTLTTKLKTPKI